VGKASSLAPQTAGTKFLGAQLSDANFVPPDSMGAVGPTQYVVVVNGRIRSFDKATGSGDGVLDATTNTFFNSVRNSSDTSDPHIRFDRLTGRWFMTMINVSTPNRVLITFSNAAVITSTTTFTFNFYDVGPMHPGCLWDYDTLGIDVNALYIGGNLFCGGNPTSDGLMVPKTPLLAGAGTASDFPLAGNTCPGGEGPWSPQGVDNYDPAATVGYFAGVSNCSFGRLDFVRITNPGGNTPASTALALTVPATSSPLSVPAQGSTNHLDALDDRLFAAHLRNGHLWTAHNICVNSTGTTTSCDRDGSRWYNVANLGSTPTLNQSGTVYDPATTNPRSYWIPSIMVSGQGHAAMGTSVAGNSEHAEAATMGRLASDAPGTMQAATVYQTSSSAYNLNESSNPHRWGDYSYTSLDPNDDMTMWTIQEFTNATDSWGVEVVKLLAPPPATPTGVGGGPFYTNRASQTVNITGTSSSGSGFFDPGNGFTSRLQAAVSGGVVVNSATYVDPTHVNLNISTVGVTSGLKNLTVTNPDGQSVVANNFIQILALPTVQSAVSTSSYSLPSSDGATWQEIDASKLRLTASPSSSQSVALRANADLWTDTAGYNQDLGIFVSDNGGADQLLAWKESGGFGGTFSPNAAYAQHLYAMMGPGHTYVFKLKWKTNKNAPGATIYSGAGPIGGQFSPTSLFMESFPAGVTPSFAVKTNFSSLLSSDGSTWQPIDAALATTLSPGANATVLLGANADLWTDTSGYNQDLAIFVSCSCLNGGADTLVAWKESGGSGGTFSPNAAYVRAVYPMTGGNSYAFKLKWKTNKNAPGATIYAGAGPISGAYSPTSLLAESIAAGANPYTAVRTNFASLASSDGATWQPLDPALDLTVSGSNNTYAHLGANADLWTDTSGYNQDLGIFVSDNGGADTLLAWKESGGFAGTFSPNAAFVQAAYPMSAGHTYVFKLKWKTNKNAPGATIYAGAGPIGGQYSPTRVVAELTN
jgi:hypothetical protein